MSAATERPELPHMALDRHAGGPLTEAAGDVASAVATAVATAPGAIGRSGSHLFALAAAYPLVSAPAALLALLTGALLTGALPARPPRPRTRPRRPRSRTRAAPGEKGGATPKPAGPPAPARA